MAGFSSNYHDQKKENSYYFNDKSHADMRNVMASLLLFQNECRSRFWLLWLLIYRGLQAKQPIQSGME